MSTSVTRAAGWGCVISGIMQLAIGSLQALFPAPPSSSEFILRNTVVQISHVLVFIGVIGLTRSDAAGKGWLAKIGLGITLLMSALYIPAELILLVRFALGELLLALCGPLLGVGLTLTGVSVVLAGRWRQWRRLTPLLCGLYPLLVMIPAFAITQGPNFRAIGGWGVCWALLGLALVREVGKQALGHDSPQRSSKPVV